MADQMNGHSTGFSNGNQVTVEEIKAAAAQLHDHQLTVIERVVADGSLPFEQKSHDLMIRSVDKIAQEWLTELRRVRDNTAILESMVLEQVTTVKNALTKLHLLGAQTMREAERGHDVIGQLADELDAMMGQTTATNWNTPATADRRPLDT